MLCYTGRHQRGQMAPTIGDEFITYRDAIWTLFLSAAFQLLNIQSLYWMGKQQKLQSNRTMSHIVKHSKSSLVFPFHYIIYCMKCIRPQQIGCNGLDTQMQKKLKYNFKKCFANYGALILYCIHLFQICDKKIVYIQ